MTPVPVSPGFADHSRLAPTSEAEEPRPWGDQFPSLGWVGYPTYLAGGGDNSGLPYHLTWYPPPPCTDRKREIIAFPRATYVVGIK